MIRPACCMSSFNDFTNALGSSCVLNSVRSVERIARALQLALLLSKVAPGASQDSVEALALMCNICKQMKRERASQCSLLDA